MTSELSDFAARLRVLISQGASHLRDDGEFNHWALELFALQFKHNLSYQRLCQARNLSPKIVEHWSRIPAAPTVAFKELELTSIPQAERTAVFHSSGTTEQRPSRHFHNEESLALYEASAIAHFNLYYPKNDSGLLVLTPQTHQAPNSSLIHMFGIIRAHWGATENAFAGTPLPDGSWSLDFEKAIRELNLACERSTPLLLLGTAFSFVHLLDRLVEKQLRFQMPKNSRVMETGGYKNRSRSMPKEELHGLIADWLGLKVKDINCEYGMSELGSQAYDRSHKNCFDFPAWARAQIISPETGKQVSDGETGLVRIFDLANVFSVMSIQTEDLAISHGEGFELKGRAQLAEPRGCSLMNA